MSSRKLKIGFLLFLAIWYGVILPGHTRGQITLPGTRIAVPGIRGITCCNMANRPGSSQGPASPAPADEQRCAMCYLVATLQPPPPPLLKPPPLERAVLLSVMTLDEQISARTPLLRLAGRAPPAA